MPAAVDWSQDHGTPVAHARSFIIVRFAVFYLQSAGPRAARRVGFRLVDHRSDWLRRSDRGGGQ